ncbi:MAG TPA: hypothetical protein VFT12_08045 [Thermoanaerobaculia bacterium]|nr:hypothetical protein [Thermoanaerobaculia bacterium]
MRLVATTPTERPAETEIETILLSPAHLEFLGQLSRTLNPDMPVAFGGPHAVRTLLERLEEAELDLSAASSEQEITRVATAGLRQRRAGRR